MNDRCRLTTKFEENKNKDLPLSLKKIIWIRCNMREKLITAMNLEKTKAL